LVVKQWPSVQIVEGTKNFKMDRNLQEIVQMDEAIHY
jgi:hypothetical protein